MSAETVRAELYDRLKLAGPPSDWSDDDWLAIAGAASRAARADVAAVPRDVLLAAAASCEAAAQAATGAKLLLELLAGEDPLADWSCPDCGGTVIQRGQTFGTDWAVCDACGTNVEAPEQSP